MLAAVFVFTEVSSGAFEQVVTMAADTASGGHVTEAWRSVSSLSGALRFN